MTRQSPWLLLALLGPSSCLVPGLEIGPEPSAAGSSSTAGHGFTSGGTHALSNAAGGSLLQIAGAGGGGSESSAGAELGGGAGRDAVVRCDEHPVPPKELWSVTASSSSLGSGIETDPLFNPPSHVADGALDERWASGQPQEEGQWFHVDFGVDVAISHVILQQGRDIDDFPRGYEISVSERHTDFDAIARASGHGASVSETVIPLEIPVVGRYMLIKQTGSAKAWWSIAEISVECH
jgi:hypothetical protein